MSWETAAAWAACLVLPGVWGWLVYRLLGNRLRLSCQEQNPAPSNEPISPWDYQI